MLPLAWPMKASPASGSAERPLDDSLLQGGPGLLASTAATALGVDRGAVSAAVATRWSVVFSPLLEYVALLTAGGRCVQGPYADLRVRFCITDAGHVRLGCA